MEVPRVTTRQGANRSEGTQTSAVLVPRRHQTVPCGASREPSAGATGSLASGRAAGRIRGGQMTVEVLRPSPCRRDVAAAKRHMAVAPAGA